MPAPTRRRQAASATVPQAWHSPHRPTHLGACQPHSLQRNAAVDFAMTAPYRRGTTFDCPPARPPGPTTRPDATRPAPSAPPSDAAPARRISWSGERSGREEDAMNVTVVPAIPVVLSTSSVYPEKTPDAFDAAAKLGYDGVEVMVYTDPVSQSGDALARLVDYHQVPVLAVHAPGLLLTQLVWGREPWAKLMRAKDLAERLGAKVVVVHPPFRWQREDTKG